MVVLSLAWILVLALGAAVVALAMIAHRASIRAQRIQRESETRSLALTEAQRLEVAGQLAGGIAHEFNNRLTPVVGNAELLEQTLRHDDERAELAQEIVEAARLCAELTRDLLTVARRTPARKEEVAVDEALRRAAEHYRHAHPEGPELHVEGEADVPAVDADPAQLEQVIVALLDNARQATAGAGRIDLRAWSPRNAAERCVVIEVEDHGCGIDIDTLTHVFEPYFTTRPVGQGRGLGLALARGIAEAHRGRIELQSESGKGTHARMIWPAYPAGPHPADQSRTHRGR